MDLIETIGPILGIVAFFGLAFLAFLIFQQSREVRRLREWAGRSPERALEADDATAAAAEARGEAAEEPAPGRLHQLRERFAAAAGPRWASLDRRLPVDGRYLLAALGAAVIAAGVLTGGFGLLGGDGDGGGTGGGKRGAASQKPEKDKPAEVAVLNATQVSGIQGVPGLAGKVASEVVKPTGFDVTAEDNASSGFAETVVMFEPGAEEQADELAAAVGDQLGQTPVEPMDGGVREKAEGATLALVIGQDDSEF
jgi:hypothetical protein